MEVALTLRGTCLRLPLRRGARIGCLAGSVWITLQADRNASPSPDIVLSAGEFHHVVVDATYFLTSLDAAIVSRCTVDLGRQREGRVRRALRRQLCAWQN